jgi:replicative DNA helicase
MTNIVPFKSIAPGREQVRFDDQAGLLGYLLSCQNGAEAYRLVATIVDSEHFTEPLFRGVFHEIGVAIENGATTSPAFARHIKGVFADNVNVRQTFQNVTDFLVMMVSRAIIPLQLEAAARMIRRDWLVDQSAHAQIDGDFDALAEISKEVGSIDAGSFMQDQGIRQLGGFTDQTISHLNELHQTGIIEGAAYAGSHDIEDVVGGWKPGRYYVIGARPSMGKSTFGLSLLRKTASKGHGVLIISLEMTGQELGNMAMCDQAFEAGERIEYRDIQPERFVLGDMRVNNKRLETLIDASYIIQKLPLKISDKAGQSIPEIRALAAKYAQELAASGKRLEVVMIDHLNLIKPDDRYRGVKTVETEQISNQLKILAKDLNIAVICLVQLNRGVEGREDKMPALADLRWSGAIEQDADVVMFLYRKAYYLERKREDDDMGEVKRLAELDTCKNMLEVLFAKNRGGPCPVVKMFCDMGVGVIRDMEK